MRFFPHVILLMIIFSSPPDAKIVESVPMMRDVKFKVEEALQKTKPEDVLVAFDIDMTLTQPDHPAAYYPTIIKYRKTYKEITEPLSNEQHDLLLMHMVSDVRQKLVEDSTPAVIQALQDQGIRVIAFTASLTGRMGTCNRLEERRYNHLKSLGLNFERAFLLQEIIFKDLPSYRNNYPVFYKGVLCSNGEKGKTSKGSVLVAFLQALNIKPEVIILVDDKKKHLEDVEVFLNIHNPDVCFIGIEYKGAFSYVPPEMSEQDFRTFWQEIADRTLS